MQEVDAKKPSNDETFRCACAQLCDGECDRRKKENFVTWPMHNSAQTLLSVICKSPTLHYQGSSRLSVTNGLR